MLDRQVVQEFLESQMKDIDLTIPEDFDQDALVEAFCQYTEDDYYEWLKGNFKSFFDHGDIGIGSGKRFVPRDRRAHGSQPKAHTAVQSSLPTWENFDSNRAFYYRSVRHHVHGRFDVYC